MYTVTLNNILKSFNAPKVITYLSLDVEGAEHRVLKPILETNPNPYVFLAMTIERPKIELRTALKLNGYKYLGDHGGFGDTLWVHHSVPSIYANASILQAVSTKLFKNSNDKYTVQYGWQ